MNIELETTIIGIPARVVVTRYAPPTPSNNACDPLDDVYDAGEIGYLVYDRRGYLAPWLEAMLTAEDETRIEREIAEHMENNDGEI